MMRSLKRMVYPFLMLAFLASAFALSSGCKKIEPEGTYQGTLRVKERGQALSERIKVKAKTNGEKMNLSFDFRGRGCDLNFKKKLDTRKAIGYSLDNGIIGSFDASGADDLKIEGEGGSYSAIVKENSLEFSIEVDQATFTFSGDTI